MIDKIKTLKRTGLRLGDINALLNAEGFFLPWDEKQTALFFRHMKKELTTADWNDKDGNKVRLIFTPQTIKDDLYDSTLNVIEVEYFTIEEIVKQIRKQLHDQRQ